MADNGNTNGDEAPYRNLDLPGSFEGETVTRRRFFEAGVQAVGGVAAAGIVLPVVGFSVAPMFDQREEEWQAVGETGDFDKATYTQVTIELVDDIGPAGKSTAYVRAAAPETFTREKGQQFVAISTRCAHLGCPVRFIQAAGNFICPCHGGVYDFQGQVVGGPPVRPLDRFQTRVRGGKVELGPRFSVTSQLDPVRPRDPGQFTDGIGQILYPPRPSVQPAP